MRPFFITKASGERERFSPRKLARSLAKAGASRTAQRAIVSHILGEPQKFQTTAEIYRHAFEFLRKVERPAAARFTIKTGIMQLGPEGFLFEKLVAEILKAQGYVVQTDQIVQGRCVRHEIDVIAGKGDRHFMVECKFHNQPGIRSDVKIPLYIQARFEDVAAAWRKEKGHVDKFHQAWIVTNTKFTSDATQYGACAGLKLIGWSYPADESLEILINRYGLFPVTCLTALNAYQKRALLNEGIVLCKDLEDAGRIMRKIGLSESAAAKALEEARNISDSSNG